MLLRHGEKPEAGLGQLDCQGLNRALALPPVLAQRFGRPSAIFAPDPAKRKADLGVLYDYQRPLATIEPTAIALGLPVDVQFGVDDTEGLATELLRSVHADDTLFVAWEHRLIEDIANRLLAASGAAAAIVPHWKGDDFDSLYVVRIERREGVLLGRFEHAREGLDGQSEVCPTPSH